jgi:hypothetical protein
MADDGDDDDGDDDDDRGGGGGGGDGHEEKLMSLAAAVLPLLATHTTSMAAAVAPPRIGDRAIETRDGGGGRVNTRTLLLLFQFNHSCCRCLLLGTLALTVQASLKRM